MKSGKLKNTELYSNRSSGFTLVEIVVTITIAMLFIVILAAGYQFTVNQSEKSIREATSRNIAQANLSKYLSISDIYATSFNCLSNTSESNAKVLMSSSSSNAEDVPKGNYGNFQQRVIAYARAGCNKNIIVQSEVTYGASGEETTIKEVSYAR